MDYSAHGSNHFDIREFVHPRTWAELGESSARCQWLIDPKIVRVCDLIRELSGVPCIVNNWHFYKPGPGAKKYVSSGYRAHWDSTGASYSQHRAGRAADIKPRGYTPEMALKLITNNLALFLDAGLTTIEDISTTQTWLHVDCRPRLDGSPDLLIVKP